MSAASSSVSGHRSSSPVYSLPLVPCPDCAQKVLVLVSRSDNHSGWVYYKCKTDRNPCRFWHWELEYVEYLILNRHLIGVAAADALRYAKATREKLEREKEAKAAVIATSIGNNAAEDGTVFRMMNGLLVLAQQMLFLMKLGLALVLALWFMVLFLVLKI